jgi:hypothetical protein
MSESKTENKFNDPPGVTRDKDGAIRCYKVLHPNWTSPYHAYTYVVGRNTLKPEEKFNKRMYICGGLYSTTNPVEWYKDDTQIIVVCSIPKHAQVRFDDSGTIKSDILDVHGAFDTSKQLVDFFTAHFIDFFTENDAPFAENFENLANTTYNQCVAALLHNPSLIRHIPKRFRDSSMLEHARGDVRINGPFQEWKAKWWNGK